MTGDTGPDRLSAVSTMWTVLRQAHGGHPDQVTQARELLLARYGGAVRRYLMTLLRDPHAADDLTQEFAIRLVTGKFHAADGGIRDDVAETVLAVGREETGQRLVEAVTEHGPHGSEIVLGPSLLKGVEDPRDLADEELPTLRGISGADRVRVGR